MRDSGTDHQLQLPPSQRQRRYVALLFADLSGSSQMPVKRDAEEVADALGAFRDLCRRVVEAHHGLVARIQGDGMLALFGYPRPAEDATRHALQAALDLRDEISAVRWSGRPLKVHSGVGAGLVLVEDGDLERGRVDLVGSLPNIVARLSEAALPGEVLVAESACGPDLARFSLGMARAVRLQRSGSPQEAEDGPQTVMARPLLARAVPAPEYHAHVRRGLSRLLGRDAELESLESSLRAVLTGASAARCATVSGAAGIGKSRLVEELCARLGGLGHRVARGHCQGYLSVEPLEPLLQAARTLVDGPEHLHRLLADPAQAGLLASALGLSTPPMAGLSDLGPALVALLAACAAERPLLLLLEDWHWADDATHQVLRSLIDSRAPLAVVLTSRDDEVSRWSQPEGLHLALEPLSHEDAASAIALLLPGANPLLVAELQEMSGGVPLFLEELCHAAEVDSRRLMPRRSIEVSSWIGMLVEARLDLLPQAQREFLELCATVGTVQPRWLLAQLLDDASKLDLLAQGCVQADVLVADGSSLRFKHVLVREALYGLIPPSRRRSWHARVYASLRPVSHEGVQDDTMQEVLARQADGAGWPDAAADHAERAGDRAMSALSFDLARRHYAAAVRWLDSLEDPSIMLRVAWARAAGKLAIACVFDPLALVDGVGLFERALANACALGDPGVEARARYWLAYILYAKGCGVRAAAQAHAALDSAEALDDRRLAAQVRATLGQIKASSCHYREAVPLLDEALQGKRRQAQSLDSVAVGSAYTLACKGGVLGDMGHFEEAHRCFDEALVLLRGSDHPVGASVRGWIGVVLLWQGRHAEALAAAVAAERIAERARVCQLLALNRALAGYARWRLGDGEAAYLQTREATGWIRENKGDFYTSLHYGWLIEMAIDCGPAGELRRWGAALLWRARARDLLGVAQGGRALARDAARRGDPVAARRYLTHAQRAAAIRQSPHEAAANAACAAALGIGLATV